MLKKILGGIAILVLGFLGYVASKPAAYHYERSVEVAAPAEVIWAEISDFQKWEAWSHWAKADPEQNTEYTGEAGMIGHANTWDGEKTGSGSMKITELDAPKHLKIALSFKTPMEGEATTDFYLKETGDKTEVTWTMDGENGFAGKFFDTIMPMEKMIGSAYEEGLAGIKDIAEAKAAELAKAAAEAEASAQAAADAPAEDTSEQ